MRTEKKAGRANGPARINLLIVESNPDVRAHFGRMLEGAALPVPVNVGFAHKLAHKRHFLSR